MNYLKDRNAVLYIIIVFFTSVLLSNCTGRQHTELQSSVQRKLDEICNRSGFPGATLGIILEDKSELAFATGLSDVENNVPMKSTDRLFTGSQGKTFVSAVLLQMIDEGKITLEDKLSKYFNGENWFSRIPNHSEITVKMLMNHTGGLPRYVLKPEFFNKLNSDPEKVWKPVELLEYVFDDPPVHEAGNGWAYSDTDYIILGMIIEKISGNTFYNELQRRILGPFKLNDTIPSDRSVLPGLVPGYTGDKVPPFNLPAKVMENGKMVISPQFEWCGGGLITTSLDLARWAKILYEGKVFSQNRLNDLLSPVNYRTGQADEVGYGLGVFIFNTPSGKIYGHHGIFPGYETSMLYIPDLKIGLALQINADSISRKLDKTINQYLIGEILPVIREYLDTYQGE